MQHIKTVHFLKISKTTWTKSYFLISPYRIPSYVNEDTWVVYEYGQSHICGGTMVGTGSHMTGSDVTGSPVTGKKDVRNRKYAMRMHNWKFRNTLVVPFHRKLATGSDVIFPRIFISGREKYWLGCSLRRPRLPLSLVICPFYFHDYI